MRGSAKVSELTWGDDPDLELIEPLPDFGNKPSSCRLFVVSLKQSNIC